LIFEFPIRFEINAAGWLLKAGCALHADGQMSGDMPGGKFKANQGIEGICGRNTAILIPGT
jgi:hypothetical protein